MRQQELTYWVTLAFMPTIYTRRKNEIYAACYTHTPQISIVELFENTAIWIELKLSETEIGIFQEAKSQLINNAFLLENLLSQGYQIIPITSPKYPRNLKSNLKMTAPIVLFAKGNIELLNRSSTAIVGSRNANDISLEFTCNVAKKECQNNQVIVSGFAKGVDKEALDAAIKVQGESIVVLPQGITTFTSGFKQLYKQIIQGRVLVISHFHPKIPWRVECAMERNKIIYGLADKTYVAQSDSHGGTWSGAIEGLRKGRTIFVRYPNKEEKNANLILIQKGARAVNQFGNEIDLSPEETVSYEEIERKNIESKIEAILTNGQKTIREIKELLSINWTDDKLKKHLRTMQKIEECKIGNRLYFKSKTYANIQISLFDFS